MDRSLVSRATDGSDAPTPGYLYNDISKNAASSPVACSEIALYLTRRLSSKNNPNIKYKCLKIISKVSVDPITRGQFKRAVSQDANAVSAIKEALQFRGPQDAARGDLLNERVRTAAKEALDAIYSDTPVEQTSHNPRMSSTNAYGASPHASSGGPSPYSSGMGTSSSGGKMQGIGNPMYADPRLDVQKGIGNMTVGEVVGGVGETIAAMVKDPLARNVEVPPPRHGHSGGYTGGGGGYSGPPPGRSQLASATNGQWTMASNRGPGAVTAPPNFNSDRDAAYFKARDSGSNAFSWAQQNNVQGGSTGGVGGGVGGSWGGGPPGAAGGTSIASQARQPAYGASSTAPSVTLTASHAPPSGTGGTAASDGSYERNLIMELCPPGGMKAEPPPDKLANFARAVPSLDPDLVCPALLDCLEEGQPWIIRAKALCVMDVVIGVAEEHLSQGGTNAYADFFHACRGEIEPLASHPRAAIKEPAKRVLRSLGIEAAGVSATSQPGFRPPKSSVAAPAPVAEAPNLLDFDQEPAAPAAPAVPAPAASPPTQPPADSLFGGLTTKEAKTPATAPPPPPPPPPPSTPATSQENLVSAATSATAPVAGGDMFGNMTVKSTPAAPSPAAPTSTAADAAPAASGSAFGFMNANSPAAEAAPAPAETATSPTAAKPTFDPLLSLQNVSPNTAKATLTPAQIQQLAYQQLMMQQQQQMQMAYAMGMQPNQPGMQPNVMMMQQMQQQQGGSNRNIMMNNAGAAASSPFSFIDAPSKKKEDKQFDFVQDAMKDEK